MSCFLPACAQDTTCALRISLFHFHICCHRHSLSWWSLSPLGPSHPWLCQTIHSVCTATFDTIFKPLELNRTGWTFALQKYPLLTFLTFCMAQMESLAFPIPFVTIWFLWEEVVPPQGALPDCLTKVMTACRPHFTFHWPLNWCMWLFYLGSLSW
jgi:hypothetical protein